MPTFSVVIPAYRSAGTIAAALGSVAAQTIAPLEVVVVDDHSPDETSAAAEQCREMLSRQDIQLHIVRQNANAGPSSARNVGIERSRASHVSFLDADDIWHPRKLEIMRSHLAGGERPAMLYHAYTDGPAFDQHDDVRPATYRALHVQMRDLLVRNSAQTSCVIFQRDCPERFDERARYCEDYDLWLRIVEARVVVRLVGPPLTRLGRPQLARGGLSGNTSKMRAGEIAAYYRFCSRQWFPRAILLPGLIGYSILKHGVSRLRRRPGAAVVSSR